MTVRRFVYVHGNGSTHWSFAWAPWLKGQLELLGYDTFFETMPDSILARRKYWLPFLRDHVGVGPTDVLIGWSSGAVAAMRYAESCHIAGSILVAPYVTDLGLESERTSGYFDEPWDWEAIKTRQDHIAVLSGDDDPYIPQTEFAEVADRLKATHLTVPAAGHFVDRLQLPELLEYVRQTYPARRTTS